MLVVPIKKKWFDMILSGEKKEEYREIKPYYTTRFKNIGLIDDNGKLTDNIVQVLFRNGYSNDSPSFIADVSLDVGTAFPRWCDELGKIYYRLKVLKISDVKGVN